MFKIGPQILTLRVKIKGFFQKGVKPVNLSKKKLDIYKFTSRILSKNYRSDCEAAFFLSLTVLNKSNSLNVAVNKIRISFYIFFSNHNDRAA
jgi:hypothetical protein